MIIDLNGSDESQARSEKMKIEAFRRFMDSPLTRYTLTTLGEAGKGEATQLLLSAAFEAGVTCGERSIMVDLAQTAMAAMRARKPREG